MYCVNIKRYDKGFPTILPRPSSKGRKSRQENENKHKKKHTTLNPYFVLKRYFFVKLALYLNIFHKNCIFYAIIYPSNYDPALIFSLLPTIMTLYLYCHSRTVPDYTFLRVQDRVVFLYQPTEGR